MKILKKLSLLAVFITAFVCLAFVVNASAEEIGFIQESGTIGENHSYTFDFETGTLIIDGTGKLPDYSFEWYEHIRSYDLIKHVIINDGTTIIGEYAFGRCAYIEDVRLPSTLKEINEYAFVNCNRLKTIIFPESLEVIGFGAFLQTGLSGKIIIPKNVKEIQAFAFVDSVLINQVEIQSLDAVIDDTAFFETHCFPKNNVENFYDYLVENFKLSNMPDENVSETEINERLEYLWENVITTADVYYNWSEEDFDEKTEADMYHSYAEYLGNDQSIIIGHKNSTAQKYADANGLSFKCLENESSTNPTISENGFLDWIKKIFEFLSEFFKGFFGSLDKIFAVA